MLQKSFPSRLPTPGLCAITPSRSCSHTDALAQTTLPPFDVIATHESVPLLTSSFLRRTSVIKKSAH